MAYKHVSTKSSPWPSTQLMKVYFNHKEGRRAIICWVQTTIGFILLKLKVVMTCRALRLLCNNWEGKCRAYFGVREIFVELLNLLIYLHSITACETQLHVRDILDFDQYKGPSWDFQILSLVYFVTLGRFRNASLHFIFQLTYRSQTHYLLENILVFYICYDSVLNIHKFSF